MKIGELKIADFLDDDLDVGFTVETDADGETDFWLTKREVLELIKHLQGLVDAD